MQAILTNFRRRERSSGGVFVTLTHVDPMGHRLQGHLLQSSRRFRRTPTARRACALAWLVVVALATCLPAGCTTSPMMTDLKRAVDGNLPAQADSTDSAGAVAYSNKPLGTPPLRKADSSQSPFAVTDKGREIERSLGVQR